MRKPSKSLLALAVCSLLSLGCGSSNSTEPLRGSPTSSAVYTGFILGRVKLSPELAAGPVEIRDLNGNVVHQLQADRLGWFWKRGHLPVEFVALARRGSDVYVSQVQTDWHGGTIYINAGTTLSSAYRLAHPGLSQAQTDEKIRQFYRLPNGFPMSWVSSVNADGFSTKDFFSGVRGSGGLEGYLRLVVRQIDGSPAPKSLLESGLGLVGKAVTGCISDQVNTSVGAVTSNMGLNFTTADALKQIQSQLTSISEELTSLQEQLDAEEAAERLANVLIPLRSNAQTIQLATNNINLSVQTFQSTHGTDPTQIPYNAPSTYSLGALIGFLNSLQLTAALDPIRQSCTNTGPAGLYQSFANEQMALANLQANDSWNGYSYRYNTLTRQQQNLFATFSNAMAQGAFLGCEYANLQINKAFTLAEATNTSLAVATDIQTGAQQVPDLLASDELILDLSNQVMWYNAFCSVMAPQDAFDFADQMEIGPYDDFALPSQNQLVNQLNQRVMPNTNPVLSYPGWPDAPSSSWIAAFAAAGFDTTNYQAAVLDDGIASHQNNEGSWCASNSQPTDHLLYFWNNTATANGQNPSTDTMQLYSAPFLVCRAYPGTPETSALAFSGEQVPLNNAPAGGTNTTTISPLSQNYIQDPVRPMFPVVSLGSNSAPGGQQLKASHQFLTGSVQNFGAPVDVTGRVVWTSSNSTAASISNLVPPADPGPPPYAFPGPIGWVTWHPPLDGSALPSVTFTASLFGCLDNSGARSGSISGTQTLQPPTGLTPILNQVQFFPRNQFLNLVANNSVSQDFTLIAYYADGQLADVSTDPNTTWTLRDANGNVLNSQSTGGFGVLQQTQKNHLYLTQNIPTPTVQISVSYAGRWGTASASGAMGLLLPDKVPNITRILPASVSQASITPNGPFVTITGSNLAVNSSTVVTFGGVPSTNVLVVSPEQLSVLVPPSQTTGSVPIVVSTSQGDSTFTGNPANFIYNP